MSFLQRLPILWLMTDLLTHRHYPSEFPLRTQLVSQTTFIRLADRGSVRSALLCPSLFFQRSHARELSAFHIFDFCFRLLRVSSSHDWSKALKIIRGFEHASRVGCIQLCFSASIMHQLVPADSNLQGRRARELCLDSSFKLRTGTVSCASLVHFERNPSGPLKSLPSSTTHSRAK